eukprot:COSAG01_NODE_11844_length_1848_cov_1.464265_1_plen_516_part_10
MSSPPQARAKELQELIATLSACDTSTPRSASSSRSPPAGSPRTSTPARGRAPTPPQTIDQVLQVVDLLQASQRAESARSHEAIQALRADVSREIDTCNEAVLALAEKRAALPAPWLEHTDQLRSELTQAIEARCRATDGLLCDRGADGVRFQRALLEVEQRVEEVEASAQWVTRGVASLGELPAAVAALEARVGEVEEARQQDVVRFAELPATVAALSAKVDELAAASDQRILGQIKQLKSDSEAQHERQRQMFSQQLETLSRNSAEESDRLDEGARKLESTAQSLHARVVQLEKSLEQESLQEKLLRHSQEVDAELRQMQQRQDTQLQQARSTVASVEARLGHLVEVVDSNGVRCDALNATTARLQIALDRSMEAHARSDTMHSDMGIACRHINKKLNEFDGLHAQQAKALAVQEASGAATKAACSEAHKLIAAIQSNVSALRDALAADADVRGKQMDDLQQQVQQAAVNHRELVDAAQAQSATRATALEADFLKRAAELEATLSTTRTGHDERH